MKKTKVVVTGGMGFIGSNVVELLVAEGYDVHIIDDMSTAEEQQSYPFPIAAHNVIESRVAKEGCVLHTTSVNHSLRGILSGAKYVFHLAAHPRVEPSIQNPLPFHHENINGSLNLFWACKEAGVEKIIFSSSSSVYGEPKSIPTKETDILDPMSPYALHKLVGEQYLELFHKLYGVNSVSLRYFNVYGDRQPTKGSYVPVMGIFFRQLEEGRPLSVTGDGLQERDFVNVKDVASANLKAALADLPSGHHAYNVGTGEARSIKEIAEYIHNDIKYIDPRFEPQTTCADISKAKQELGWEPKVDLFRWIAFSSPV